MLERFFKKQRKKVTVLGLDGVPYTLLTRLGADPGGFPNFARVLSRGTARSMNASIPEVSSTSWTCFMTAVNPGRHGIYGFTELPATSYAWRFPSFADLKARTLWDIAAEHGRRSTIINVPSTYPAKPLQGMLVSGFVALDLKKACYPESLYQYLNRIGYRLDVNTAKAAAGLNELAADIMETFRKRQEAILHLHGNGDSDLFIGTVTETDRLHHYFWDAFEDTKHPQHDFVWSFYRELDVFLGRFVDQLNEDDPFVMLSDHGFTLIKQEVYLNTFMQERGYLKFDTPNPKTFDTISSDSVAFVLDPARVYLHRRGRYQRGSVQDGEYESLRESIKSDLLGLKIGGENVIREVLYKEQVYSGDCCDDAPDLVALPYDGYDLKGALGKPALSGSGVLSGGHTRENALLYVNRPISGSKADIVDAGATVLHLLGIEVSGLDGVALA
ncbi:MAG: alkaline phosphatase family protein [Deltaproteobacteria bacterium]|nr:alkaline phosphatase family protein [Deltaproteobacteria bacterium]